MLACKMLNDVQVDVVMSMSRTLMDCAACVPDREVPQAGHGQCAAAHGCLRCSLACLRSGAWFRSVPCC